MGRIIEKVWDVVTLMRCEILVDFSKSDYLVKLEEKREEPEHLLRILNEEVQKYGLIVNIGKTKTMIFDGGATNRT